MTVSDEAIELYLRIKDVTESGSAYEIRDGEATLAKQLIEAGLIFYSMTTHRAMSYRESHG